MYVSQVLSDTIMAIIHAEDGDNVVWSNFIMKDFW